MRVELAEKNKLETARNHVRRRFEPFLSHIDIQDRDIYWGEVEVLYQAFYAYEEVLATFSDRPNQTNSLLAAMERITRYLTAGQVKELIPPQPDQRDDVLARYASPLQASGVSPSVTTTTTHRSHYFISYSPADAQEFVLRLADTLAAGPPSFPIWLDRRQLRAGDDWDEQIVDAIRSCESVLFVMTRDSVSDSSVCKVEWTRALRYKKPIVPLFGPPRCRIPFRLANRQYIDFTSDFARSLARLRDYLQWLQSPDGKLHSLRDCLSDAQLDAARVADRAEKTRLDADIGQLEAEILEQERALPRTEPEQQARIREDIAELERQIAQQQKVIDNPKAAEQRVQQSIEAGLEGERKPANPSAGSRTASSSTRLR